MELEHSSSTRLCGVSEWLLRNSEVTAADSQGAIRAMDLLHAPDWTMSHSPATMSHCRAALEKTERHCLTDAAWQSLFERRKFGYFNNEMPKATIYSVNCEMPGAEFEQVEYHSRRSLLDADIIVFTPTLEYGDVVDTYQGKPKLGEWHSTRNRESVEHWRRELVEAINGGKTVFVLLEAPKTVFIDTGHKEYSGTGKNARVTNFVAELGSYASLPISFDRVVQSHGRGIKRARDVKILDSYWQAFGAMSQYEVYYEIKAGKTLLVTASGDKAVGTLISGKKGGSMLLLPPLDFSHEALTCEDAKTGDILWTQEALMIGKQFTAKIVEIHRMLKSGGQASPPPEWVSDSTFTLLAEKKIADEISNTEKEVASLLERTANLQKNLEEALSLKALLYETGKPLERAIIKALRILGFKADGFRDAESEFDIVFEAGNRRFIGEAEGKDNTLINIDKLQQLERNVQEDYAKEERMEFATGVMFGNAKRLLPPRERGDFFTEKCLTASARTGIVLVRTPDLFLVAKYVEESRDQEFACRCREAFSSAVGRILNFPMINVQSGNCE